MSEGSDHDIILRDVYIVTHVFPITTNIQRKLLLYRLPGVSAHYSVLTQGHVFHISSELAQNKLVYFKGAVRGQANLPLHLKTSDISAGDKENIRYRVIYCGRTPYRIPHVRFYAKFVRQFFDHYSITFSNCVNYAASLAAMIINRETQTFLDPIRNGRFIGTLRELTMEENRRQALCQAGRRPPLYWPNILNLKNTATVWRIQGLTWIKPKFDTPGLCPLAEAPEYGILPSPGMTYGQRTLTATRLNTFLQLLREYKNTSRWYV